MPFLDLLARPPARDTFRQSKAIQTAHELEEPVSGARGRRLMNLDEVREKVADWHWTTEPRGGPGSATGDEL